MSKATLHLVGEKTKTFHSAEECKEWTLEEALKALGREAAREQYIQELEAEIGRLGGSLPLDEQPGFEDLLGV